MVNLGRNIWDVPVHNTYVPVRHTIMPKPDLQDTRRDDLLYRFNDVDNDRQTTEQRVNPIGQLNPLKGYRMGPAASPRHIADHRPEHKKWSKWRRLSKQKNNRAFSTSNIDYSEVRGLLPTNILTNPGFIEYLRVQNWE